MLNNLIKISFRNLINGKFYTLINVLGLTLGISCSLFLLFFVLDELSYDRFFDKGKDIYRVVTHITETDNQFTWSVAQIPFAPAAKRDYPEVDQYVRINQAGRLMFKKGEDNLYEENIAYSDSVIFQVFSFQFLSGDRVTCLYEPNSIVLTRDLAMKYFDKVDAAGETLEGEGQRYKVTGVIENIPKNTHLRDLEGFISYNTLQDFRREGSWGNFGVATYLYTPGLSDPSAFQEKVQQIYDKYCAEIFKPFGVSFKYELQNIPDIHLYSKAAGEAGTNGDISYVYIFSAVAFFMLLIAGINYMNLATARSMRRAREVGVRKIMGSSRKQLIAQFLTESVILTITATLISILIVILLLPWFNNLLDKGISPAIFLQREILLALLGIALILGIISGSYPAFFLSSFKSVNVLKSNSSGSSRSGSPVLRKALVILQFAISVTMITSTWLVYDQLGYLRTADLGFSKENIIRINLLNREMTQKYPVLRDELKKIPAVVEVGTAGTSPGQGIGKNLMYVENDKGEMVDRGIDLYAVDYDYVPALGMRIVEGRNFSRDIPSDTARAVLVTESMAKRMNWESAIGKKFNLGSSLEAPQAEVVGVVKDYHHRSLYDIIEPILFLLRENNGIVHIKISGNNIKETITEVENAWKNVYPGRPFEFRFLDEEFDEQYKNDQMRGTIFSVFSIITITIACLGLLGLASYTTEQRTREIGIRKVVGASVNDILMMISKDFVLLVLIAIIVSVPVAWMSMEKWLQNFAYRIDIGYLTFILAALAALFITFITIG
ncbi:MAG TPA: ABC transporter permease, partial [Cyclobacteriaceae bacterium]|nr:ABC transporter permease [Cyclobacteriaceae bacterium]